MEAHNVGFEWAIWTRICVEKWGWPEIQPHHWRDTMAVASYYALPSALDKLAKVLCVGSKDTEGTRLISKYSKLHLKTATKDIPVDEHKKFVDYCRQDVEIERKVSNFLGDLPDRELPLFLLQQKINQRGLYLDAEGIEAAVEIVDTVHEEKVSEFEALVGIRPSQREKLLAWLFRSGYSLPNLQKATLEQTLGDGHYADRKLTDQVIRAIELRLETSKASTKKLDAMARNTSRNGRALYQSRYHGASTGRPTGSGFQPLNLKRGYEHVKPEQLVRDIKHRSPVWLDCLYGDAITAVANASRHWIRAERGNEITAGDYSSIEAILLSCEAGEQWKVDAFRNGDPIYELMGCKIHGLDEAFAREDKKAFKAQYAAERQDGKTGELAFGYQGALNAWLKFDKSGRHSEERIIEICKAWRKQHPNIVRLWYGADDAALSCVETGEPASYRNITFERVDEWLTMILPDGKRLWYWWPEIRMQLPRWHEPDVNEDCANMTCKCKPSPRVTYMTQKSGQWIRTYGYGGKWVENYIQALSRQILMPAMLRIHERWSVDPTCIILTVYDEVVCEAPVGMIDLTEFRDIMIQSPGEWADDYPISAEVWQGLIYKK